MQQRPMPKPTPEKIGSSTPGERLLYALGQHYLRWHNEPKKYAPPHRLDILAVARGRWVCAQVEYIQAGERDDGGVTFLHLPSEVMVIDGRRAFPWRLLSLDEWGEQRELRDFLKRAA